MNRREFLEVTAAGTILKPKGGGSGGEQSGRRWEQAYPIDQLTPRRKIGGLIRFSDPSFFYAADGRVVTSQGRFKRHRTFMFPHYRMERYPYRLRVRMVKRDIFKVRAGMIFGAKTPYEFELGGDKTHGALLAYVNGDRLEFRDHRTEGTQIWKASSAPLTGPWSKDQEIILTLEFGQGDLHGSVSATVAGALQGRLPSAEIDLGRPDDLTGKPHVRGLGYFGFAVDGPGEVEILEFEVDRGSNSKQMERLDAYTRPCEWCVLKESTAHYLTITFALREAGPVSVEIRQNGRWSSQHLVSQAAQEREGGHTIFTHKIEWEGSRPDRYRLLQGSETIFDGRVPPFNENWSHEREVVGLGVACQEVWRYKQQNQRNWYDNILTQAQWQGDFGAFGNLSHNMGDTGTEYLKYQGVDHSWPDFLFGGDDYPGYPDNPILTLAEVDYQQRIWDVLAINDSVREFHGSVPSAFKGGDHEFANSDELQPGGFRGSNYPGYIMNAYRAIAVEGHTPIHPEEVSFISRPIPGWIEIFHVVSRYNQEVNIGTRVFPGYVDKTAEQSASGFLVIQELERWARTSPAPFKIVHGDHPLGDIRDVSAKETYRLYPWERGAIIRLIAETGLLYAIGDEHNLRLVRYTDFSQARPSDERLQPLRNVSVWEFGISNLSGEWFRHVRENEPSGDGFDYEVLYQSVPKTGRLTYGYQERNGYTVWRFNKQTRTVRFEIWQRHGESENFRAREPRREPPNFAYVIDPRSVYWASSYLPDLDLAAYGLPAALAANQAYTVNTSSGAALFSNRADSQGRIAGMPCPPLLPGAEVELVLESGVTIQVTTRADGNLLAYEDL